MKIGIAGDNAGHGLADVLAKHLAARFDILELSENANDPDELYAHMSDRVCSGLMSGLYERAILVCGTGIGVCISANKVAGIRAALCHDTYSAERAVLSNNAQVITMGARVIGPEVAKSIADTYLERHFDSAGRSAGNVKAIDAVDAKYST